MELNEEYIHIKSGRPYTLITDNFMFNDNGAWRRGLCLYRADYKNQGAHYFARTREDFFEHFKKED